MIHMLKAHGAHRRQGIRATPGALGLTVRYARELTRTTVKNRLLWALVAAEALLLCLALALPPGQLIPTPFNRADATAGARLALEGAQTTEGVFARMIEAGRPLSAADHRALEDARTSAALAEDLLAAEGDRAFYTALARQLRWFEQQTRAGNLLGGNAGDYALEAAFLEQLVTLDDPRVFERTADMPLLTLLTAHWQRLGRIPLISALTDALVLASGAADDPALQPPIGYAAHALFTIPLVAVALIATRWQTHRRLAAQAPVPRAGALAATLVVSTVLTTATLGAIMLPTATFVLLRNGMGDAAYPVAYYFGTEPVLTTAGLALCALVCRILLVALCVSALALSAATISHRVLPGAIVLGALAALPLAPQYFDHLGPLADIVPWLPSTYLCIPETIGAAESIPTLTSAIMSLPGVSVARGRAVLGATALAALALSVGIEALRWSTGGLRHGARADRTGGGGTAPGSEGTAPGDLPAPSSEGAAHGDLPTSGSEGTAPGSLPAPGHKNVTNHHHNDESGPDARGTERHRSARTADDSRPAARTTRHLLASLALTVAHAPVIAVAVAALVIVATAPAALPLRTGMDPFTQEHYRERIRQHRQTQDPQAATFDAALATEEQRLVHNAAYADGDRAFAEAAATYETWRCELIASGELVPSDPGASADAARRAELYTALAGLPDPRVITLSSELPAVAYLAHLARLAPVPLWGMPSLATGAVTVARVRCGLMRQAPVPARGRGAVACLVALIAGVIACAITLAGAMALACARNGWGDPQTPSLVSAAAFAPASDVIARQALSVSLVILGIALIAGVAGAALSRDTRRTLHRIPSSRHR